MCPNQHNQGGNRIPAPALEGFGTMILDLIANGAALNSKLVAAPINEHLNKQGLACNVTSALFGQQNACMAWATVPSRPQVLDQGVSDLGLVKCVPEQRVLVKNATLALALLMTTGKNLNLLLWLIQCKRMGAF
eukprot:1101848-Amphidinium_carterae.1